MSEPNNDGRILPHLLDRMVEITYDGGIGFQRDTKVLTLQGRVISYDGALILVELAMGGDTPRVDGGEIIAIGVARIFTIHVL